MKESRVKRLIAKKLARRLLEAEADDGAREALEMVAARESADTISKMYAKGFKLLTRLEGGEGVFVRESDVVALHVQLPRELYGRLDSECRRREVSKRQIVTEALKQHLAD